LFSGTSARLDFYLPDFTDVSSLVSVIRNLAYVGGGANMAAGLRMARTGIFPEAYRQRPNVKKIIILVTGGQPDSQIAVLNEVRLIKDLGITVVGVGITTAVSD